MPIHHRRQQLARPLPGKDGAREEIPDFAGDDHALNRDAVRQRREFAKELPWQMFPQEQAPTGTAITPDSPASDTSFQTVDERTKSATGSAELRRRKPARRRRRRLTSQRTRPPSNAGRKQPWAGFLAANGGRHGAPVAGSSNDPERSGRKREQGSQQYSQLLGDPHRAKNPPSDQNRKIDQRNQCEARGNQRHHPPPRTYAGSQTPGC